MIVKMIHKGVEYDLSNYIDPIDNTRNETIEKQLDSGKLVISMIKKDAISGLDMSVRLPSFALIYFNNEKGEQRYFYTADTTAVEVINGRVYRHEINLIELSKELQYKNLRDMTITQPQDGNYYANSSASSVLSANNIETNIYKGERDILQMNISNSYEIPKNVGVKGAETNNGIEINNTLKEITYNAITNSNTDIIEDQTIKESGAYEISYNIDLINPIFDGLYEYNFIGYRQARMYGVTPILELYYQLNDDAPVLIREYTPNLTPTVNSVIINTGSDPAYPYQGIGADINLNIETLKGSFNLDITGTAEIKIFAKLKNSDTWRWRYRTVNIFGFEVEYNKYFDIYIYLNSFKLKITKQGETAADDEDLPIKLGEVVQKINRLSGLNLVISDSTLARLNQFSATEDTYTDFTVWDAYTEVAGQIGAIPEIIINDNGEKELIFNYYSDLEKDFAVIDPPNVEIVASGRSIENYVGSLQLNAKNVVSNSLTDVSPYNNDYAENPTEAEIATDWMSLRAGSDGNIKITTDNIGLKLPLNIYQIRQVEIKGFDISTLSGGVLPYNETYVWKLNDDEDDLRIVEKTYYDTLLETNDYETYDTRVTTSKNNCLYYIQGDNRIYGFNFTAQYPPRLSAQTQTIGIRSLYEMLFVKAILKSGISEAQFNAIKNNLKDPGTVEADNDIRIRVTYIPYDYSRANIYKEDLSGFNLPHTEKYYNETAIVNDPKSLGSNTQDTINRLGNTVHTYIGYAKVGETLPYIGSKTSDGKVLTSITKVDGKNITNYVANYVQDFSIINDLVGIKSPHRQYQIPNDAVVLALDKQKTHIYLSESPISSISSVWNNIADFFDLMSKKSKAPLFAEVSVWHYESDIAPRQTYMRPITKTPTGKTISFKYQMENNYSAGTRKNVVEVNGEDVYFQEEVNYTTKFGRVYKQRVRLVKDVNKNAIISSPPVEDLYPILNENIVTDVYSDYEYEVYKDAREIMALAKEVSFHSGDINSIIIYDGIASYNPMCLTDVSRNNIKIGILNDDYKVSKTEKLIDIGDLQNINGVTLNNIGYTVYSDRIEFDIPPEAQGKGLVIYNDRTSVGDLILIYLTKIDGAGAKTIYFGTKNLGE
jgi:hypothetical protein